MQKSTNLLTNGALQDLKKAPEDLKEAPEFFRNILRHKPVLCSSQEVFSLFL